ncbi:Peptidase family S41 [Janthinobacterium psychrotolerans]|uniref:Peptidase family S41 n=2 Tax=Janthinobacterium psychrotolerans TaxID=1747903 RepID=A0A1A7BXR7_9BURK|nr:Peptidase family S41 [Janthinobacterium psychrotolerans]
MKSLMTFLMALLWGTAAAANGVRVVQPVTVTFRVTSECGVAQDVQLSADAALTTCPGKVSEIAAVMPALDVAGRRLYLNADLRLRTPDAINLRILITAYHGDQVASHSGGDYLFSGGVLQASAYIPSEADKVAVFIQVNSGPAQLGIQSLSLSRSSAVYAPGQMSGDSEAYLERAFDKLTHYYLYYDAARLRTLRHSAGISASGAVSPADLSLTLKDVARLLGDPHSRFLTVEEIRILAASKGRARAGSPSDDKPIDATLLAPDLAYVKLVSKAAVTREARQSYAHQVRDVLSNMHERGARRWIIDLREQSGGSTGPLIAGFRPLYGNIDVGYTIDRNGKRSRWAFGIPGDSDDQEPYFTGADPMFDGEREPVALLIGNRTASAGEALLTAFLQRRYSATFGTGTAGLTTSVFDRPWPDGASLAISTGRYADRNGQVIQGKIAPDHALDPQPEDHRDAVLEAARHWISQL